VHRLVLVSRYPRPGSAKTRLIPALGPEGAAAVQRQLAEATVAMLRTLPPDITLDIYFADANLRQMRQWLGEDLHYSEQPAGPLGDKLAAKAAASLRAQEDRLVFIGTDCPALCADDLIEAFTLLDRCDVVIGPALDGGYYLLGLARFIPQLFVGIPWGGEGVFAATLTTCRTLGLRVEELLPKADIDRPEDLDQLRETSGKA